MFYYLKEGDYNKRMNNWEIAKILSDISFYLEIGGRTI